MLNYLEMRTKKFSIAFVLVGGLLAFYVWSGVFLPRVSDASYALFTIAPGQGVAEISTNLEQEDFIKSRWFFQGYAYLSGQYRNLQSGVYRLSASQSIRKIASVLSRGNVFELRLSIPEGYTLEQIEQTVQKKCQEQNVNCSFNLGGLRVRDLQKSFTFLRDMPGDKTLEGFLFPDTYQIALYRGERDIARAVLSNFSKKLTKSLRQSILEQDKSIYEIVTVASLLEREVTNIQDKKIVAGIIWKRLEAGMPLEIDATLTYVTGKASQKLSRQDLRLDNPYNTYRYPGLPPSPIANPGLESIQAAIYPQPSPYWYYLTTQEGTVLYSSTLQEHLLNKAKHL